MAFSRPPVTASDGTFSAAGAAAWAAGFGVAGATVGGIPYFPTATTETTSAGLTFNASAVAGEGLAVAAGAATTNVQAFSLTQTWNNAAITFGGLKYTVTDTASAAASLAFQVLGGAAGTTNLWKLSKDGSTTQPGDSVISGSLRATTFNSSPTDGVQKLQITNAQIRTTDDYRITWSSDATYNGAVDLSLSRISAGLLGIGTGAAGSFAGSLKLTDLTLDGLAITKGYTVAGLPAGVTGAIAHVTNQLTSPAAKGVAPTGGGTVVCPVFYNGAAWVGA